MARSSVEVNILGCALALAAATAYGAEYVGSKACASCHSAQYASFQQTPMGRSFAEVTLTAAPELSKPAQFFHPKTGRGYRIFRKPGEFLIEESFADYQVAVHLDQVLIWRNGMASS